MGSDYSYAKVYAGENKSKRVHHELLELLRAYLTGADLIETTRALADRSLVVGPPDLWIHVGDSTATCGSGQAEEFKKLAYEISATFLVATVEVDDDAQVVISLLKHRRLLDFFSNGSSWFSGLPPGEDSEGNPRIWADELGRDPESTWWLREYAWNKDHTVLQIVENTSRHFGWDLRLSHVGYTHDAEGIPRIYDEHLHGRIDPDLFSELHFSKAKSARNEHA